MEASIHRYCVDTGTCLVSGFSFMSEHKHKDKEIHNDIVRGCILMITDIRMC